MSRPLNRNAELPPGHAEACGAERGGQLVGDSVREILLGGVAAHVDEREHCDGPVGGVGDSGSAGTGPQAKSDNDGRGDDRDAKTQGQHHAARASRRTRWCRPAARRAQRLQLAHHIVRALDPVRRLLLQAPHHQARPRAGGMAGRRSVIGSGVRVTCAASSACGVSPENGVRPVSSS